MIETPQSISDWSIKVFPTLSEEAQNIKLFEEVLEFFKAKTLEEKIKELADIYIVACILKYRFGSDLGFYVFRTLFKLEMVGVYKAVDKKMEINRSRKWACNGKTYHHEGKDD